MKTKTSLVALALALACALAPLPADTVASDTAVFVQADAKSPVITRLKSGDSITYTGEAPTGWRRVEVSGPFTGFVLSHDLTKGLDVRTGSNVLVAPDKASPVLTVMQKGDRADVTGIAGAHGEFCQIRIEKKLEGFVATGLTANTPAPGTPTLEVAGPAPAPVVGPTAPGRPVAITGNTADLPRFFSGTLVAARRAILNPNPPYDYQLTDSNGRRFAYVDTHRLVVPEKIDAYLGLVVTVTGTIRNTVDGKDLVIEAETMQRNPPR